MSGVPGVGSVVIYYLQGSSSLIPVPSVVICTHDSWSSDWQSDVGGGRTQPASGQVVVFALNPSATTYEATEGTGAGQFSRVSLDLDLGTLDLGSVDLSAQVATGVVVPDV